MRNPQQILFPWAYQDRAEDPSQFRQLASRWRPLARVDREEDGLDVFAPLRLRGGSAQDPNAPVRPTWSPWLWVK
jgi:hypothetical protein